MLREYRAAGAGVVALALAVAVMVPMVASAQDEGGQTRPSAAQRYYISGTELMKNVRYLDAAEQFRLAIDEDPEYIDAYKSLAFVFTKMAESESEYYEDSLELYEQLQDKLPDDVEIRQNKAYVLTQLGELREAVDTYTDILDLKPDDCATWAAIADLEKKMAEEAGEGTEVYTKGMKAAVNAYEQITAACPAEAYAYNALGELYFGMGDIDAATSVYDKLLDREPDNVEVNGRVGYLWYQAAKEAEKTAKGSGSKHYDRSLKYFRKVLELDGERSKYRRLYADALKGSGHSLEAAKEYEAIIAEDATQAGLYCNVGFTYLDAEEYEKAIELAMKAIAENAPSQGCLYSVWGKGLEMRANKLVDGFEFDRAIATYTDAKAKFTLALGDKDFGDYAAKQISRQDQLIERAKQIKLKNAEGGGSNE